MVIKDIFYLHEFDCVHGKFENERMTVLKNIDKGFMLRNKIVHGQEYNKEEVQNAILVLREYLRMSINTLITLEF